MTSNSESQHVEALLQRIEGGEPGVLEQLLQQHRRYLRRLVEMRMQPALRQRFDPSDVVQDALLKASQRIEDFLDRRPMSFRLWLRSTVLERLIELRRQHEADKRNVHRDLALTDASSLALAQSVLQGRPSERLSREELMQGVRRAMARIPEADRELLMMRHAEELTNAELAELLQLEPKTVSKRYGRALLRLSAAVADLEQNNTGQ